MHGDAAENLFISIRKMYIFQHDIMTLRVNCTAALIHLWYDVCLIGVVNGTSHQPEHGHAASGRLNLAEYQK